MYPPHLAEVARRQAETQSLPPTSPQPTESMGDSPQEDTAASESGRTYTVSENSLEQQESPNLKRSSPSNEPKKLTRSPSLDLEDRRSPIKGRRSTSRSPTKDVKDGLFYDFLGRISPSKDKEFDLKGRTSPVKDVPLSFNLMGMRSPDKENPHSLNLIGGRRSPAKDGPLSLNLLDRRYPCKDGPLSLNIDGRHSPSKNNGPLSFDLGISKKSPSKDRPSTLDFKVSPTKEGPVSLNLGFEKFSERKDGPTSLDSHSRHSGNHKDRKSLCKGSPTPPDFKEQKGLMKSGPHSHRTKDSRSPDKDLPNGKKSPVRSPLSDLFKSKTTPDATSGWKMYSKESHTLPSPAERKFAFEFKERSMSLDMKNHYSCKSPVDPKKRSPSFDLKGGKCLKENSVATSQTSDNESSSDEECLSTTTFTRPSPQELATHQSSFNDPSSKLAYNPAHIFDPSTPPEKPNSWSKAPTSSTTSSRQPSHENHVGGKCLVHSPDALKHNTKGPHYQSSPSPVQPRIRGSSSSSSARSSTAESQLLLCGMCAQRFSNPKVLPCLHTFCESCLITYTPAESLTLTCPICRQQSILPKDGVKGLQSNRWVTGIIDSIDHPPEKESCHSCEGAASTRTCLLCDVTLCDSCATKHKNDSGSECHSVVSLEEALSQTSSEHQDDTTFYCSSHSGQTLRWYCRNCETAVCSSCTAIEHRSHNTMRLSEAVDDQKLSLHKLIERVTTQLPVVKEVICDLNDISTELDERRHETELHIRSCFTSLHEQLDVRKTELMNSLNSVVTVKKNSLTDQKSELEEWVSGVEGSCEYVEKVLTNCPAMEVVLVKKQLGEKLIHFAESEFPPVPKENASLEFSVDNIDCLTSAVKHIGSIQTNSAVAEMTVAVGDALKKASIGRVHVVTVVTRDHKGQDLKRGGVDIAASISKHNASQNGHAYTNGDANNKHASPSSSRCSSVNECETQVLDLNNGTFEISFTLRQEGLYKLSLLLNGLHISQSPFTLHACRPPAPVKDDLSDRSSVDNLHRPTSIKRQISRSTQKTSKVSLGSKKPLSQKSSTSRRTNPVEDDLIFKIGRKGRSRGEFVNPQGICYSTIKDGRIVVADSNNQCVQVFTLTGECKIKFGVRGRSVGQLQRPTGVAALPNGHYAVADYENRWVSVFEPSGKYVNRIGHGKLLAYFLLRLSNESTEEKLLKNIRNRDLHRPCVPYEADPIQKPPIVEIWPKGLCVNNDGNLIVVDNKASLIYIFTPGGKLLNKFGNRMLEGYNFAGPHFCAVNSRGDIIITDFHNHCVRVFDCEGISLFMFGSNGEGNGQFNAPTGVAVDENDNIIVADWGNSRIQIFDSQGSFLSFVNTQADPLYGPQGLALTGDGNIVVADSGNHCFKMYKYLQ